MINILVAALAAAMVICSRSHQERQARQGQKKMNGCARNQSTNPPPTIVYLYDIDL